MMMETGQSQNPLAEGLNMSAARLLVGLCVTCNNAETCVFRKRRGCDALHCETFDNFVSTNGGRRVTTVVEIPRPAADTVGLKGLCVNCAHASDCKLPRPTSGVWHCGEYE
jgi:hypothetical protein